MAEETPVYIGFDGTSPSSLNIFQSGDTALVSNISATSGT